MKNISKYVKQLIVSNPATWRVKVGLLEVHIVVSMG